MQVRTRGAVLEGFAEHLDEGARAVIGFGAERGYPFDEFRSDVAAAGLAEQLLLGGWDLAPFTEDGDFLVAVVGR